jgi:transposase
MDAQPHYPVGIGYPLWFRRNVIEMTQTRRVSDVAAAYHVSERTVQRYWRHFIDTGSMDRDLHRGGREKMLWPEEAASLLWYKLHHPAASLGECKNFIETASPRNLSISTQVKSMNLKRLGLSRKMMTYFSTNRDENDRVLFWTNPPNDPVRPGVLGVPIEDFVDIDESGLIHPMHLESMDIPFVAHQQGAVADLREMVVHYRS